jgi:Flp pilus assembly protein TadD
MATVYEPSGRPAPSDLKDTQPVLESDPARAVLYQGRGIKLVSDGRLEPALDQFRRAAAFDPSNASVLINIAYVLDKLGRYEEAITQLKEAEKIDSRNSMIFLN